MAIRSSQNTLPIFISSCFRNLTTQPALYFFARELYQRVGGDPTGCAGVDWLDLPGGLDGSRVQAAVAFADAAQGSIDRLFDEVSLIGRFTHDEREKRFELLVGGL